MPSDKLAFVFLIKEKIMAKDTKTEVTPAEKGSALQKTQPMRVMSPFEEMERMMESFFPRAWLRPSL